LCLRSFQIVLLPLAVPTVGLIEEVIKRDSGIWHTHHFECFLVHSLALVLELVNLLARSAGYLQTTWTLHSASTSSVENSGSQSKFTICHEGNRAFSFEVRVLIQKKSEVTKHYCCFFCFHLVLLRT